MDSVLGIALEKPGIITISETLRKQLGLVPGMSLVVEGTSNGIRLRVKERPPYLAHEGHVLVYNGELIDKVTDFVQQDREQQMAAFMQ